jgi:predicted PurR-regulated permease PerM
LWILTPILTIVIFGAILAYYVRHITKKIKPYVKNDSLSVFLGMIILAIPIILLLYFYIPPICKHSRFLFRLPATGRHWQFHHAHGSIMMLCQKSRPSE